MGILINENQIGGGASNSSHNIGDIFYTTRTDNSLNGAVECNGSQYNFSDFDSNLQTLFDEGKLPYLPISEFDSMVTNQGGCDSFGYGTRAITLYPIDGYSAGNTPGDGVYYSNVYDWYTIEPDPEENYILHGVKIYDGDTHEELVGYYVTSDPVVTGLYYYELYNANNEYVGDIVSPSFSHSGEPIPVGELQATTYFKVPKKIGRVLVRSQKPTADNDYTWYNLYSDGWCEQGGICPSLGYTVIFPVVMSDVNYTALGTARDTSGNYAIRIENMTTTGMKLNSSAANNHKIWWQVSGYAATFEYTRDKWDYQNIKVERPMIQLFNGNTDTALATCTEVLADVSNLKQSTNGMIDYVIETQIPTPENNYTWYRLYKSGWVEQGGYVSYTGSWIEGHIDSVVLPIEFANTDYRIMIGRTLPADGDILTSYDINKTTTGFGISSYAVNQSTAVASNWFAVGMSAQGNN